MAVRLKGGTLLDEYTRQCLAIQVERQITADQALAVLEKAMAQYGVPDYIRSDNGPEFIAKKVQQGLKVHHIKAIYIDPSSPWQNGKTTQSTGLSQPGRVYKNQNTHTLTGPKIRSRSPRFSCSGLEKLTLCLFRTPWRWCGRHTHHLISGCVGTTVLRTTEIRSRVN
jgi:hypothetical protein